MPKITTEDASRCAHALQYVLAHTWPAPGQNPLHAKLWCAAAINLVVLVAKSAGLSRSELAGYIYDEWKRTGAVAVPEGVPRPDCEWCHRPMADHEPARYVNCGAVLAFGQCTEVALGLRCTLHAGHPGAHRTDGLANTGASNGC